MRRPSLWLALGALASEALSRPSESRSADTVKVHWVGDAPEYHAGTTFGLPWPQGKYRSNDTQFSLSGQSNEQIPLQSWVTGYWRDGSIKWTGHAIPPLDTIDGEYRVSASTSPRHPASNHSSASSGVKVTNKADGITVDTGKLTASFPKQGNIIVGSITTSSGKVVGENGKLVLHTQSGVAEDVSARANASINYFNFQSNIENVTVSKDNAVRTLVTVKGKHQTSGSGAHDDWLPFSLRFYFYANSDSIRVVHSIVFDGKPEEDFITGLGIQFEVPLEGEELYNRHIRLPGVDGGYLNEAVQGITGLRRDPGEEVRSAQYEGKVTPNISTWDERVSSRMQWIPVWNDYKLSQLSPDGFTLKKRTKPGQAWINIPGGTRSSGLAYLGGATQGGLAIGLRDFWKRYPAGLDITNAGANKGQITLWLYSPEAAPLDLRPFHDGLGQDTYEKQTDALEITYEDYEPGFNTPYGIARTSEIFLHAFDATPESDNLALLGSYINEPPVLVPEPEYIKETKAAGSYWALPDTSNDKASTIENHLDFLAKFYQGQVEARRWYGFLDYGDIMHTYDEDRHTWRYDVGGYAWDNSELSPDLFFWQYFLRTGRADIYRFAEALTRHTGEVDVYHIGNWKGLGTRHGVQHFADSAKQVRIAQPQYRKYFYYLSGGDERVGELLEEAIDADKTYGILDPQRKVRTDGWTPEPGKPVAFSLGTDWAGLAAGWLIEWERRGPRWQEAKKKLTGTAKGIASFKNGFVTGEGLYAISNGTLLPPPTDPNNQGVVSISHLNAVFGMPEVVSELLEYWGDEAPEGLESAWLDYCYYYGATKAEQQARYGESFSGISLIQGHSRLTAYYAKHSNNVTVAERAWKEFYNNTDGFTADEPWVSERVNGSAVLIPVDEATWISTNAVAQYGLAAIQDLALVGDAVTQSPYGV
ncbi:hypothetical protein ANOM_003689 [Aspergillus nomiae NRRL 13137]|uniref:YetA n=1 Tax=Aspergillus nomiae NRRL (strain ATCC 15546 / NRRL 13137 / CBS 260.88 / M93) TaxID=1509407 RepID=A0A0L1JAT5_ASPN3|nr:uncharacterized protein ANOM_003689 [Aspergillus nomiae NRRL 13137]KNG88864.1 hypothetical protein ANOM_003689 [Aspergillus nomiae NRRL 13137]